MSIKRLFFSLMMLMFATQAFAVPTKVILVIFENTDYQEALAQPFFAQFAKSGALLTNYSAVGHPSQPNYVAMVGGSTMGIWNDFNTNLNGKNLADLLEAQNHSWHVYAEGFPGNCYQGSSHGTYARKHNPLISFTSIQKNPARCANITDATSFARDYQAGKLADFTMYIPDLNNDGHDTSADYADKWFAQTFSPLLQDAKAMDGVLVIATFDEDDGGAGNHIYFALNGPDVKAGSEISAAYDHYSMLRTVEDLFQLGNLGQQDASATPISGFLK